MLSQSCVDLGTMRVDQVGSLLRPTKLKECFARSGRGECDAAELRQVQDEAVREVLAAQEAHSLPVLTDGEFRRLHFMESFADVAGFEQWQQGWQQVMPDSCLLPPPTPTEGGPEKPQLRGLDPALHNRQPVTERLRLARNRPLEEYLFASNATRSPVKVTLIGPDRISQGFDAEGSRAIYAGVDEFLADVIAIERQIVDSLAEAGCRYVQIDAPGYMAYVDGRSLEAMRARGQDPWAALERSIKADNAVIAGFPEMIFGLHVCRGNRQSMWHREGTYDAIAEALFAGLQHQRLLVEYDTERAGSFAPLRFVPKGKMVVLGLITTKVGKVETVDDLKRRIDEAARYVPIEQLALSPQCGFASVIAGNLLSEEEQWRKLDVMLETAAQVWE